MLPALVKWYVLLDASTSKKAKNMIMNLQEDRIKVIQGELYQRVGLKFSFPLYPNLIRGDR
jgi:hypothetical protein